MKYIILISVLSTLLVCCHDRNGQVYSVSPTNKQIVLNTGCQNNNATPVLKQNPQEVSLSSWNAYNLFDLKHDQENGKDKNDWQYGPQVIVDHNLNYISGPKDKFLGCQKALKIGLSRCKHSADEKLCKQKQKSYFNSCINTNWTQKLLDQKINNLTRGVKLFKKSHRIPDILLLSEVENPQIIKELAIKLGYIQKNQTTQNTLKGNCKTNDLAQIHMTTSPDERGIDVGILINPTAEHIETISCHEYDAKTGGSRPTRNILELELRVDNCYRLFIYSNHWPSQAGPTFLRVNAAKRLGEIIQQRKSQYPDSYFIAGGDFNVVDSNDKVPNHPIHNIMKDKYQFTDLWQYSKSPGSYYYAPNLSWNKLDRFLLSKNLMTTKGLRYRKNSFVVHSNKTVSMEKRIKFYRNINVINKRRARGENIRFENIYSDINNPRLNFEFKNDPQLESVEVAESCAPLKFSAKNGTGFSDHFAISMALKY